MPTHKVRHTALRLSISALSVGVGLMSPALSIAAGGAATSGELLAPADSGGYAFTIYTNPSSVDSVTVSAVSSWSSDWYPNPGLTRSSPALVEIPFNGGSGCDFISFHPENNFAYLDIGTANQNETASGSISIGPGRSVAIAGSDCGLSDNFHAHFLVRWSVGTSTTTTTTTRPDVTTTRPATTTTLVPPKCNGLTATIVGTSGPDNIIGTAGNDVIVGLGGNDRINGAGGSDTICGGDGDDVITGDSDSSDGTGAGDVIFGDAGNDKIAGCAGNDQLSGGPGNDEIFGDDGIASGPILLCLRTRGELVLSVANDYIAGGDGDDQLLGGDGTDRILGEAGNDVLSGGPGVDELRGGPGNDRLSGDGPSLLFPGVDACYGDAGSDTADRTCDFFSDVEIRI